MWRIDFLAGRVFVALCGFVLCRFVPWVSVFCHGFYLRQKTLTYGTKILRYNLNLWIVDISLKTAKLSTDFTNRLHDFAETVRIKP